LSTNRREFLKQSVAAAAVTHSAVMIDGKAQSRRDIEPGPRKQRPNIIIYLADQFRWDFVGANQLNPTTDTPNLDEMAARGTVFTHAVTNQPLCAPSRSVLFTGRYATETGVWHNVTNLDPSLTTLAGELRKAGYTANLIGKWHLAPSKQGSARGYVPPEFRGGFLDLWEGANELEYTSQPYEGIIYDGSGREIHFKDEYRADFLTDRAESFLRQKHDRPFLLYLSQLEPHFQNLAPTIENESRDFVAPHGAAQHFQDPFVPGDLKDLPGNWQSQLPNYYGCCQAIDRSVGRIRRILQEESLAENTILIFISDHGCHFMTRNEEYKRSPHNASIRIPLIVEGPGFNTSSRVDEIIGNINITPTLLEAAELEPAKSMKGRSFLPLLHDLAAPVAWPNAELIQISESMLGRAIRTRDWMYCVADPDANPLQQESSLKYRDYALYDQRGDPNELTNLAGRKEYRKIAEQLRDQLKQLIVESGEPEPQILPAALYPG
jgi:arylsulfatase A-like enzyme